MARSFNTFLQSCRFSVSIQGEDVPMCEVTSEPGGRLKLRTGHKAGRPPLANIFSGMGEKGVEIKIQSGTGRGEDADTVVQWVRKYSLTFAGIENLPLDLNALNANVAMDAVVLTGVSYMCDPVVCIPAPPDVPSLSDIARQHPEIATR